MNRIYKVVWSKAKNYYTVVSEIAKRHGKGNRARTCAAAFLAAFALTGVMGMSEAQAENFDNVNTNTLNAKDYFSVGTKLPNGPIPFFVDSKGAFQAAADKFSVNEDGKVTAAAGKIGKVTIDENGKISGVAGAITADSTDAVNGSQLKQTNDNVAQNKADIGKLDNRVTNVENLAKQHTTVEAGNNITMTESTNTDGGKKYTVGMAKDITVDSVKVGDDIYVSDAGLNANGKTITNVKDGKIEKDSKDAVNGGQLYATNQRVEENASNISLLGNSINKLDNRVDKVGAGAAVLAALQPLGFDPEDKWDFAAGYGNYSGASAVALGAYYRPNEDTMFSVGGSFGNGENMVNAGVSLKLGQSNHASTSKEAAMEKKISSLSQEVEELKAAIADLRAAQTKAKDATEKDAQKK